MEDLKFAVNVTGKGTPTLQEWSDLFISLNEEFGGSELRYMSVNPHAQEPYFDVRLEYAG